MIYIFFLNLGFAIFEFVGGVWTGSTTLQADSLHDFGDALVLGVACLLERGAKKQASATVTYGYKRLNIFSSLIMGVVLLIGSAYILCISIYHVFYPNDLNVDGMLGFAIVGIVINLVSFYLLTKMGIEHSHGIPMGDSCSHGTHDHTHDHAHERHEDPSLKKSKTKVRHHSHEAMRWHLLEDLIGWISLLVLSVVLMFVDLPVLDPLLSICISLFILRGVVRVLKPVIMILLQAVPDHEVAGKIPILLGEIEHVIGYHDFHLWSLDGIDHVLTIHLVVSPKADLKDLAEIKKQFHSKLSRYGNIHSTIEIEFEGDSCDSVECTLVT